MCCRDCANAKPMVAPVDGRDRQPRVRLAHRIQRRAGLGPGPGGLARTPRCRVRGYLESRFAKGKADGFRTASDVLIMVGVFGVGVSLHFLPTNLMNCDMVAAQASMVTLEHLRRGSLKRTQWSTRRVPTSMLSCRRGHPLGQYVVVHATHEPVVRARKRHDGVSGFNGIEKDRFLFAARADEDVVVVDMVEGGRISLSTRRNSSNHRRTAFVFWQRNLPVQEG